MMPKSSSNWLNFIAAAGLLAVVVWLAAPVDQPRVKEKISQRRRYSARLAMEPARSTLTGHDSFDWQKPIRGMPHGRSPPFPNLPDEPTFCWKSQRNW